MRDRQRFNFAAKLNFFRSTLGRRGPWQPPAVFCFHRRRRRRTRPMNRQITILVSGLLLFWGPAWVLSAAPKSAQPLESAGPKETSPRASDSHAKRLKKKPRTGGIAESAQPNSNALCEKVVNLTLKALCRENHQQARVTRFCVETFGLRPLVTDEEVAHFRRCFQFNHLAREMPPVLERLGLCRGYAKAGSEAVRDCAMLFPENFLHGLSCLEAFPEIEDLRYCYATPKPLAIVFECLRLNVHPQSARHCLSRVTDIAVLHGCYRTFIDPRARQDCLEWQMNPEIKGEEVLSLLAKCEEETPPNARKPWEAQRQACLQQGTTRRLAARAATEPLGESTSIHPPPHSTSPPSALKQ